MDPISQAGSVDVATTLQVYSLNKAREVVSDTVLSLVEGAVTASEQVASVNPPHLGQNVDVTA
ncbi:hypothetical protein NH8B_1735 [Pseudogulbenkiania sp. NH8B]|uniref:Motility protein n=1 Tax=Pseudogulbenkiania ferrooxidans 2002 TaxID=279714 RepID=B9Z3H8_9NEIS|nr:MULTISPECIES: hypothetical protein [Pseudogulbenkiania]EEG08405.1 conserved hypothetical protein [Pseudogulbenkiania ferrooxidans 2002]BAK76552.1 hypothetical protein NH8B_1735 [Pseudogulbenkiania sp. NH8B]